MIVYFWAGKKTSAKKNPQKNPGLNVYTNEQRDVMHL